MFGRMLGVAIAAMCGVVMTSLWADGDAADYARQSRIDARDLAQIAPPASRSTALGLYGDAPPARSHVRRSPIRTPGVDAPMGIVACPAATGRPAHALCVRDPRRIGFRRFYVYAPSYVTAPQIRRTDEPGTTSLFAPATAAIYSANVTLFGNPSGD